VGHQSIGVDQELVSYLDRRFAELKSELKSEITGELRAEITASASGIKSELRAKILASAAETRQHFEGKILASTAETREYVEARILGSTAETRRHFDVVADSLMDKIQLIGEGVIKVDQKLERFRGEVAEEFRRVDGRLLRLEARTIG
jgi:hypothetical protein